MTAEVISSAAFEHYRVARDCEIEAATNQWDENTNSVLRDRAILLRERARLMQDNGQPPGRWSALVGRAG